MKRGTTIKLKGPGLNEFFAREMLKTMTPDEARAKVAGPALAALERVIAENNAQGKSGE